MKVGDKIKGNTEFYKEVLEAEIKEIRFHMATVEITKSTNEKRIGENLVVLLNEFESIL